MLNKTSVEVSSQEMIYLFIFMIIYFTHEKYEHESLYQCIMLNFHFYF